MGTSAAETTASAFLRCFLWVFFVIAVPTFPCLAGISTSNGYQSSPLYDLSQALICAKTAEEASKSIEEIIGLSADDNGLPRGATSLESSDDSEAGDSIVFASTLNLMLGALYQQISEHPELAPLAERAALKWNYCGIVRENEVFNIVRRGDEIIYDRAQISLPGQWQGLMDWGILTSDVTKVYKPQMLEEVRLAPRSYHMFFHQAFRQHCFPHPETGERFIDKENANNISRRLISTNTELDLDLEFPFGSALVCARSDGESNVKSAIELGDSPTDAPTNIEVEQEQVRIRETYQTPPVAAPKSEAAKPASLEKINSEKEQVSPQEIPETVVSEKPEIINVAIPAKEERANADTKKPQKKNVPPDQKKPEPDRDRKIEKSVELKQGKKRQDKPIPRDEKGKIDYKKVTAPLESTIAIPTALPESEFGNFPYVETEQRVDEKTGEVKKKRRISATFLYTHPLTDRTHRFAGSFSWSPKPNWFVRWSPSYSSRDQEFYHSWGIGYSNWRPGTWSLQLNNWGPTKISQGFNEELAVGTLSYKVKSELLKKLRIGVSGSWNVPLTGGIEASSVGVTMQINVWKNWYFRTTARKPVRHGGPVTYNYQFGHYDWRPGKWRIEYANYDLNKRPLDGLKNGAITVSRSWQF